MSHTNDHEPIDNLNINDTFYDWYLRTNQIIDFINPLNVYDVFVGEGLTLTRTGTPGTVEIDLNIDSGNYGVTIYTNSNGDSSIALDYNSLEEGTVEDTTHYSIQQAGEVVVYYVEASNMLPPNINGNHDFAGTITVGDLVVDDGTIIINNTGTSRDGSGLIVEGTGGANVSFTYDDTSAGWYSSENLGVTNGKGFVSNSGTTTAIFPFYAQEDNGQGRLDVRFETNIAGTPERISLQTEFDTNSNSLLVSHYHNGTNIADIAEFISTGSGATNVIIKDTIEIVDVLNSTPFSQSPEVENIPVTDSTDGFLSSFVNRIVLLRGTTVVGDVVRYNGSTLVLASPDSVEHAAVIGIVESVDGSNATVITAGPFSGLSVRGGSLTAGSVYYLDPNTPGGVTSTDPDNTTGDLDKPVLIATGTDSGVVIPYVPVAGGGGGGGGGGTASNAFAFVDVGGTSLVASGEDTLTINAGTHISLTGNSSTDSLTINCDIDTNDFIASTGGTPRSFLIYNASGNADVVTPVGYSVLTRSTNGNLDSIAVGEGTLVGRLDNSNNDSPVAALTAQQVYGDVLGFSSNTFIRSLDFVTDSGNSVLTFDAQNGLGIEDFVIRAGENVEFEVNNGELVINVATAPDPNGSGDSIAVGLENGASADTSILLFENDYGGSGPNYVDFAYRHLTNGTTFISAKPTNEFLKIFVNSTINHDAGDTLKFVGDTDNISITLGSNGAINTLTFSLNDTISVDKIQPATPTNNGLVFSGGDDSNRDTLKLIDATRPTGSLTDVGQSLITINAFTDNSSAISRISTTEHSNPTINNKYVSVYADSEQMSGIYTYTYPFKFHKLLVDSIVCQDLTVTTATKGTEYLSKVIPNVDDSSSIISGKYVSRLTIEADVNSSDDDGTLLYFTDTGGGSASTSAFIYKEYNDKYLRFNNGIRLMGGDNSGTGYSTLGPRLEYDGTNSMKIYSTTGTSSQLVFDYSGTGYGTIGTSGNSTTGYTYLLYNDGSNNYDLQIGQTSTLTSNSLKLVGQATNSHGWLLDYTGTQPAEGHVLYVSGTTANGTGKIGTVKSGYLVKEYVDSGSVASDPLYTLYYTLA